MHLQARAALASAALDKDDAPERLRVAETMAGRISKEGMRWADPLASLIRAGIAHNRNEPGTARSYLSDAIDGFDLADMHLYAAAARRRLGEMIGGERGKELKTEADSWMRRQTVLDVERMTRMLAPGFD